MRIAVKGTNGCANGLRGIIEREGFQLVKLFPQFTFELVQSDSSIPVLDSVDCELERAVLRELARLTPCGQVLIHRKGGNQDDTVMRIEYPENEAEQWAVQQAIYRALSQLKNPRK